MHTLDRKLWLTADKDDIVEDGDDRAAFLLGLAGDEIPDDEAERLGLTGSKKEAAKPADKSRKPSGNKAEGEGEKTESTQAAE